MGYVWQRWMPDAFRAAGLTVRVVVGWENRGRPASTGNYDPRGPLTIHHTGATTSPTNPRPTLGTLISGRSDLPGPLAPYSTGADGVVTVIAAGRCNHAGPIGKSGVLGMPSGWDGNALAMGDEVDTNGTQTMPAAQVRSMAVAAAVVLDHFDKTPAWVHRHADISGSGKWDLGSLTTAQVRALTEDAMAALNQPEDPLMALTDQQADQLAENARTTAATVARLEGLVTELAEAEARRNVTAKERDKRLADKLAGKIGTTREKILEAIAEADAEPLEG